jgi:hypothetical protein
MVVHKHKHAFPAKFKNHIKSKKKERKEKGLPFAE